MNLRELAERDVKAVFIDLNGLAQSITLDTHTVNAIILDNQSQIVVNQFENSGLLSDVTRVFIADDDWPTGLKKPVPGMNYTVNNKLLLVDKANLSYGLWKIDFRTSATSGGLAGF